MALVAVVVDAAVVVGVVVVQNNSYIHTSHTHPHTVHHISVPTRPHIHTTHTQVHEPQM